MTKEGIVTTKAANRNTKLCAEGVACTEVIGGEGKISTRFLLSRSYTEADMSGSVKLDSLGKSCFDRLRSLR